MVTCINRGICISRTIQCIFTIIQQPFTFFMFTLIKFPCSDLHSTYRIGASIHNFLVVLIFSNTPFTNMTKICVKWWYHTTEFYKFITLLGIVIVVLFSLECNTYLASATECSLKLLIPSQYLLDLLPFICHWKVIANLISITNNPRKSTLPA